MSMNLKVLKVVFSVAASAFFLNVGHANSPTPMPVPASGHEVIEDSPTEGTFTKPDKKTLEMARGVANTPEGGGQHGNGAQHGGSPQHSGGANLEILKQPVANKQRGSLPSAPELSEPEFMQKVSGTSVSLKWKGAEGVDSYHVQVATDPNFKWLVVNETSYTGVSFPVSGLTAGKSYYWRVASVGKDKDAGWLKSYFASSSFKTQ